MSPAMNALCAAAVKRLQTGCRAYRTFAIGHPHRYQLMLKQMPELDPSAEALYTAADASGLHVARVGDEEAAGLLVTRDEVEVAQQFWNRLHGGVSLELAGIAFPPILRRGSRT